MTRARCPGVRCPSARLGVNDGGRPETCTPDWRPEGAGLVRSRKETRTLALRFVRLSCLLALLSLLLSLFPARADEAATPIAPGTSYQRIYQPEGPWAINVVAADVPQQYLELHALLGGGSTVGRRAVSGMLAGQASENLIPVAGVNADYFAMAGGAYTTIPLGLQVESGELVTFPDPARSAFYALPDGTAHIGRFRADAWLMGPGNLLYPLAGVNRPPEHGELALFTPRFGRETRGYEGVTQIALADLSGPVKTKGDVSATIASVTVAASQPIPPDGAVLVANGVAAYALRGLKAGDRVRLQVVMDPDVGEMRMAVSGGPRLVREGRVSVENRAERFADSFATRRHPRTGVGLRQGAVVLVTVDGRQPGYSEGMSLPEFAQVLVNLGCTEAMNLDGGGSTTMVVRSQVVNSPSDGRERRVANALALFSTAPATGKAVRLAVEPAEANVLSGEKLPLVARGLDEYYNPVGLDPKTVTWTTGSLGLIDEQGSFIAAQVTVPTAGLVTARQGEMTAAAVICVLPSPARLVITPDRASLAPKGSQQFTVRAFDEDNRPIRLRSDRVTWSCDPTGTGATVDRSGLFRAPARRGELTVMAKVGDVTAKAQVLVAAATTVMADFERAAAGGWSYASVPAGLPGSVAIAEDPLTKGNHCLELRYDLSPPAGQNPNLPSQTRAAEAVLNLPLPDTRAISIRVLGDGQGAWLRARLRDAADRRFTIDLAAHVDWSGRWRTLTAWLPDDSAPPLVLEAVYVTAYRPDQRPAGAICLDDIAVEPSAESAATPTVPAAETPKPARRPASKPAAAGEGKETSMDDLPTYICRRTPEPIVVDGRLSERVWSRALPVGDFRFTDDRGEPQLPTEVKLCWDDTSLYLAFVAIDTDIWGSMRKRDEPIYEEEVVEAFLSSGAPSAGSGSPATDSQSAVGGRAKPRGGDVRKYFEFEWSPHNTIFDARVECPEWGDRSRMVADLSWDCQGLQSAVGIVGTLDQRGDIDQRWTVEAALPFVEIGRDGKAPAEGERWRANFYRADRAGDGEFSCWSPTLSRDFHVPARFGNLVFSRENW